MKRVLYFGPYNPAYARNRVLIKGLRENGVEIIECQGSTWRELWQKHRALKNTYDVMVVGFPGQEAMLLARWLTKKPIIFDAFTSHYGGYILDRKVAGQKSLRGRYYRWIDRASCRRADVVLLDTQEHIDFFVRELSVERKKLRKIFVGTDTSVFYPRPKTEKNFIVHFHGSGIPLQGIEYIQKVIEILKDEDIEFQMITSQNKVSYEELPDLMARADVCLGIFGDSPKTELVIPNKVYEALAMGKPVITADTPAVRELLRDRETVLLCRKADPEDLAKKILLLRDDTKLREKIGNNGFELFKKMATEKKLGQELIHIIHEIKPLSA